MRFGSLDPFLDPGDPHMGRPIANLGFVRALLTHGTWDRYSFFAPDAWHVHEVRQQLERLVPDEGLRARVDVSSHVDLPRLLRQEPFDVFHLGDFTYFAPFLAGLRRRCAVRPFPITGVTHSLDGVAMHTRFLQLLLADLEPWDAVVCTSRAARLFVVQKAEELRRLLSAELGASAEYPARTEVIPLGIEDDLYSDADRRQAREHFRIPAEAVVALSVGRLSLRTKADWAPTLELVGRMVAAGRLPASFLWIIAGGGTPGDARLLEELVGFLGLGKRVVVFANFPAEVKPRLYRAADLYVSIVDNFQETFGLSVIEAMAAGLPVIASDFSGYRDAVREGDNGFLVPTSFPASLPRFLSDCLGVLDPLVARLLLAQMVSIDLDRLADVLARLSTDPALREALGRRARLDAEAYRWPVVIRAYERLWSDLAEEARRAPLRPARSPALLSGDGMAAYAPFATRLVGDADVVELTPVGEQVLASPNVLVRYEDVVSLLPPEIERAILEAVARGPSSLAELRSTVPGDVDFLVHWLLKHGAIRVTSTRGSRPPAR